MYRNIGGYQLKFLPCWMCNSGSKPREDNNEASYADTNEEEKAKGEMKEAAGCGIS